MGICKISSSSGTGIYNGSRHVASISSTLGSQMRDQMVAKLPHPDAFKPMELYKDLIKLPCFERLKITTMATWLKNGIAETKQHKGVKLVSDQLYADIQAKIEQIVKENGPGLHWLSIQFAEANGIVSSKSYCAAQKLPSDWQQKVHLFILLLAYYEWTKKIPPALIVNPDQAGIAIVPVGRNTWAKCGSKSVPSVVQEDKRQITIVPVISAAGTAIGMRVIFQGKTERSLPVGEGRHQLDELHVHLTMISNHWASFETMQLWVEYVLVKYVKNVRIQLQHWKDHPSNAPPLLLIMDCWKVHLRGDFIANVQERLSAAYVWPAAVVLSNAGTTTVPGKPPGVRIAFIPSGCTGKVQPMDVGVQKPINSAVRKGFHAFLLECVHRQLLRAKLQRTVGKCDGCRHQDNVAWRL
ncbi:hypothetical protein EMCRGX_G029177 [Ephydatia muelleri]